MHNAFWNPVLFVIYIAEQRQVSIDLDNYVFDFDCLFAHQATLNGRSAVGLSAFLNDPAATDHLRI